MLKINVTLNVLNLVIACNTVKYLKKCVMTFTGQENVPDKLASAPKNTEVPEVTSIDILAAV
jgi:hypothetical protein